MFQVPRQSAAFNATGLAIGLVTLFGVAAPLAAQTTDYTWLGIGPDDNFSTASNWAGNVAPTDDDEAILNFPYIPGEQLAIADDADDQWIIHGLTAPSAPSQSVFEIQGQELAIGLGGITTEPSSVFLDFHLPLSLLVDQTWSASTEVNLYEKLDLNDYRLTVDGDLRLAGEVEGTGDIVKTGTGTLTFAGTTPNTFSGVVWASEGTVEFASPAGGVVSGIVGAGGEPNSALLDVVESGQLGADVGVSLLPNSHMILRADKTLTVGGLDLTRASVELEPGASLQVDGDIVAWEASSGDPVEVDGPVALLPGEFRTIYVGNSDGSPELRINDLVLDGSFDMQKLGPGTLELRGGAPGAGFNGTFYHLQGRIQFYDGYHLGGGSLVVGAGAVVWVLDGELAVDEIIGDATGLISLGNGHINAQTIETNATFNVAGNGTLETQYFWSPEPLELGGATLSPQGVGTCVMDTELDAGAGSRILLELGASQADKLDLRAEAYMYGTLEVVLVDGYVPDPGDDFMLIETQQEYSSQFAEIILPEVDGMELELEYQQGGIYAVFVETVSSTDGPELATSLQLSSAFPNPLTASTSVVLSLPESRSVRAEVFNPSGARVCSFLDEWLPAGRHTLAWDGRDDNGREVGSGVYLVKVQSESEVWTRRATVLR